MLALPAPSQRTSPGRLTIDLHMLRKTEALSVLGAILQAARYSRSEGFAPIVAAAADPARVPARISTPAPRAAGGGGGVGGGGGAPVVPAAGFATGTRVHSATAGGSTEEAFLSLEVVVGRGAHSTRGVARLKPAVASYLAGKGFQAEAVGREQGEGVVVVSLS